MNDYHQPDYYRFSEDSLWLRDIVVNDADTPLSCLDLFAGCGVIGIEIANQIASISTLTSVEVQNHFSFYLKKNSQSMLRAKVNHHIEICSISHFKDINSYDLIVANPPYFAIEKSRPSPNHQKDICRRFQVDTWEDFFILAKRLLSENGKCYFLARKEHLVPTTSVDLRLIQVRGDLCVYSFCK